MAKLMVMIDFPDKGYEELQRDVFVTKYVGGKIQVPKTSLESDGVGYYIFELIGVRP